MIYKQGYYHTEPITNKRSAPIALAVGIAISVIILNVPAANNIIHPRNREKDIFNLFKFFMESDYNKLTDKQIFQLQNCNDPGNVREIENLALYFRVLGKFPNSLFPNTEHYLILN